MRRCFSSEKSSGLSTEKTSGKRASFKKTDPRTKRSLSRLEGSPRSRGVTLTPPLASEYRRAVAYACGASPKIGYLAGTAGFDRHRRQQAGQQSLNSGTLIWVSSVHSRQLAHRHATLDVATQASSLSLPSRPGRGPRGGGSWGLG